MTRVSKCLTVLALAVSVSLMGFAIVMWLGGPNWRIQADQLRDYVFEEVDGDPWKYSVKVRLTSDAVGSPGIFPAVLLAALRDQMNKDQARSTAARTQTTELQAEIPRASSLIEIDRAAMLAREVEMKADLSQVHAQMIETARDSVRVADEAWNTSDDARKRREDGFRLQTQLGELRAGTDRMREQSRKLQDRLNRMQALNQRLEERQDQLLASGAKTDYEE